MNEADVTVSKDTGKVTSTLSTPLTLCEVADATPHANNTTHAAMAPDEVKFTVKFTASAYFDATDRPAEVSATNVPIVPEDAAKWESPPFYNATSKGWSDILSIFHPFLMALYLSFFRLWLQIKASLLKKSYTDPPNWTSISLHFYQN